MSFTSAFNDAKAKEVKRTQYFEIMGSRAAERRALQFRVSGYGTLAELVVSLYQSITSLNSEKP